MTTEVDIVDVVPGLWLWRMHHPDWVTGGSWPPAVTCTHVESGGETWLFDPLKPPPEATAVWERLDARPPTCIAVLKPDHVRDVGLGW